MDSGAAAVIARNARLKVARDYTWTTRCQNILTAAGF
jgi:hypothetical protein